MRRIHARQQEEQGLEACRRKERKEGRKKAWSQEKSDIQASEVAPLLDLAVSDVEEHSNLLTQDIPAIIVRADHRQAVCVIMPALC